MRRAQTYALLDRGPTSGPVAAGVVARGYPHGGAARGSVARGLAGVAEGPQARQLSSPANSPVRERAMQRFCRNSVQFTPSLAAMTCIRLRGFTPAQAIRSTGYDDDRQSDPTPLNNRVDLGRAALDAAGSLIVTLPSCAPVRRSTWPLACDPVVQTWRHAACAEGGRRLRRPSPASARQPTCVHWTAGSCRGEARPISCRSCIPSSENVDLFAL